jgi:predicted RNase H-like nuclease
MEGGQRAPLLAIGADGAPGGWLLACLHADGPRRADAASWQTELRLAENVVALAGLREHEGASAAVAIDVPIGLPESVRYRRCDVEARARLKGRKNSVFAPPARYMLAAAGDYKRIRELVEEERIGNPAAKSLSAQAAGITKKVDEVDAWARAHPESGGWLWECHPELSFWALNDRVPLQDKHRAAGVMQRLRLLKDEFPDVEERLAQAPWSRKQATLSDMLDAYAALTTALACARKEQQELGEAERDSEGLPMRMAV